MKFQTIFIFCFLKESLARYDFIPKFYGQDSAVIIDADKKVSGTPMDGQNFKRFYQPFPVYHIIQPGQGQGVNQFTFRKPETVTSSTSTTTTTVEPITALLEEKDEFPKDLLEIAQNKLGLKSLDEIPSISELSELLGSDSPQQTIHYLRKLTSTDQGIALMKAYIESTDYTDNGSNSNDNDDGEDDDDDTEVDVAAVTADLEVVESDDRRNLEESSTKPKTTSKPAAGFLERISNLLNFQGLFPTSDSTTTTTSSTTSTTTTTTAAPVNPSIRFQHYNLSRSEMFSRIYPNSFTKTNMNIPPKPMLMRNPLPYHYPIPLRPVVLARKDLNQTVTPESNIQKTVVPAYIQKIANSANISPIKLETFLQRKPKLAELAKKMGNIPLPSEGTALIDSQLFAAVRRAMEEDEDLKKLFSESNTLK